MTTLYLIASLVLLTSLCGRMYIVLRGPTRSDRMLVIQLFGTTAVAVLLLVGEAMNDTTLADIALVLALLAAVTVVAFVQRVHTVEEIDEPRR